MPTQKVTTRDAGEAVEIRVRDNGTGIPADIRDELFQPFFTTKPTGEGTGLGLSITYDIVTQQHGGSIAVCSEVGDYERVHDTAAAQNVSAEMNEQPKSNLLRPSARSPASRRPSCSPGSSLQSAVVLGGHCASPIARRRPDRKSSRCSSFRR